MVSDDEEACSNAKKMKIDTPTTIDTVEEINAQFPKIDNLEYFPEKVLLHIFSNVNDIDLLHLSDTSCRFEKFAKFVFKDKYTNKYFVFDDDTANQRETYEELFSRFGRYADINAIEVNGIQNITKNHWLPRLLRQHTNQLQKLTFKDCSFKKLRKILSKHMNIEHLILRSVKTDAEFILPKYRNLKKLELFEVDGYKFVNLVRTIRNNPELESIMLWHSGNFTFYDMMMVIAENSMNLRSLTELHLRFDVDDSRISDDAMDSIIDSLKNLRSLMLFITDKQLELIQRLGLACKSLKHLALGCYGSDNFSDNMIDVIRQFNTVEHFELIIRNYSDRVESVVGHMPNLRQLHLSMALPDSNTFILSLLRRCPSIETITLNTYRGVKPKIFVNLQFWNEFIEVMQHPNGKVELNILQSSVSYVTKKEIVWKNMVMHWIGYDWSHNTSKVNLLDLAKPLDASVVAENQQRSPFDHILDYLDLASLYSMSTVSKQSKNLVESYVERHAQQNGTFTISDKFHHDANGLDVFAEHVENLKMIILSKDFFVHLNTVKDQYTKLNKLSIYSPIIPNMSYFQFPQVRHLMVSAFLCDLCDISQCYPDLETLDITSHIFFFDLDCCLKSVAFRNLKKFTFVYDDEGVLENIRKIFENTATELIPVKTEE